MSVQYGYIPAPLADLATWADNFATTLLANYPAYMVSLADATSVRSVVDDFLAAYDLSKKTSPATRTKVTVSATVTARVTMLLLIRSWASQIRLNPGVSDSDKTDLGLRLPNNTPTPIPTPATIPILSLQGMATGQHFINFVDSGSPMIKAKPAGSIGMQLFRGIGVAPIADPDDCKFLAQVTKNPYVSVFSPGDAGKIATYFARWITRGANVGDTSAEIGNWSAQLTSGIAF